MKYGVIAVNRLFIFWSLLFLASCSGRGIGVPGSLGWQWTSSEEHVSAYYRMACRELGFEEGSKAFSDCLVARPRRPGQVSTFSTTVDSSFDRLREANDRAYKEAVESNRRAFDRAWERQPRWNPSTSRYE